MIVYAYLGVGLAAFTLVIVFAIWFDKGMTRRDYIAYAILVAIVALTIATVWVLGKTHHWRLGDSP
jgi:hypothetical protein